MQIVIFAQIVAIGRPTVVIISHVKMEMSWLALIDFSVVNPYL